MLLVKGYEEGGGGGGSTPEKFTGRYNTYAIRYSMVLLNQIKDNNLLNLNKERAIANKPELTSQVNIREGFFIVHCTTILYP